MHRLTNHKTLLASLTLLVFLFSANAFFFGSHAAEEMLQAAYQAANVSVLPTSSLEEARVVGSHHHHHPSTADDESHHGHDDSAGNDCCDTQHSHDLADGSTPSASALTFSTLRFIEPFAWLPEIFLDRFIPPQNHS